MIATYFALANDLWNQTYLDTILDDWKTGPLVEIKRVSQIDDGEFEMYGDDCPDDFEPIA